MRVQTWHWLLAAVMATLSPGIIHGQDQSEVSFDRDIRPILADRCFACHGPDANAREADLRLDLENETHGYVIEPGSIEDSELWLRVSSQDDSLVMPPPDSHKPRLTTDELSLMKRWIGQGANYESFWAFEKPQPVAVPQVDDARWSTNPIDAFVKQSLQESNLTPAGEADGRTLVRRIYLDVLGLPPTPEQIQWFLDLERSDGREIAWAKLVDRVVDSTHYGEQMARYWLDLVRFADTNGMHKDFYRNHFAYRDWVIRSFNQNLPYNEFLKDQLAGDLYEDPTRDQLTATAFNRLHLIIDRGTALPEESHHKNVIDRVTAVGTAFLGLTVHCAQCHDHKYDPITQKEFYSLYAFFNNLDAEPETVAFPKNGLQPPFISLASTEQSEKLTAFDQQIADLDSELKSLKKALSDLKPKEGEEEEQSELSSVQQQRDELKSKQKQLQDQRKQIEQARLAYDRAVPYAMVTRERDEVRPTHLLLRGQYDAPGEPVNRSTPAFLPPLNPSEDQITRLDLANWIVSPEHPLTGRVAVNRIWQQLFGVGIVKTSEDFGAQGGLPSHPKLLDYLTVEFVESGWDVKRLVKMIVTSQTYRQSSVATPAQIAADPENRKLARGSRFRLDAEVIRDQILASSGLLSTQLYGPSVKPPQPDGLWKAVTMINERFEPDQGDAIYRRSLYTYWKRGMPPPQMTILNAPIRDACIARRERTNTSSQALLLLNEPEYQRAARHLAQQVLKHPPGKRVARAWERVTCRLPDDQETESINRLLTELEQIYQQQPELAESACQGLDGLTTEQQRELSAWTVVVSAIFNLDLTRNRD